MDNFPNLCLKSEIKSKKKIPLISGRCEKSTMKWYDTESSMEGKCYMSESQNVHYPETHSVFPREKNRNIFN